MAKIQLTPGQEVVLTALADFGKPIDDTGLAVYVHHAMGRVMSSSGVRSRRAELVRKGLVSVTGTHPTKSGRAASIHGLTAAGQRQARSLLRAA